MGSPAHSSALTPEDFLSPTVCDPCVSVRGPRGQGMGEVLRGQDVESRGMSIWGFLRSKCGVLGVKM